MAAEVAGETTGGSAVHSSPLGRADAGIVAALFVSTALFVRAWPRDLISLDEGVFVYEAARILDGDVPYRDFFEMVTPGAWYLLALLYRMFGVDMATARGLMAAVQGFIVLAVFTACRRLGVRAGLSAGAAVFHMAAGYPTLTYASPHWISTLVTLAALHVAIGYRRAVARRVSFVLGMLGGCAIGVQQQKGVWLLVGLACFVALREAMEGGDGRARRGLSHIGVLVFGAALVLAPGTLYLLVAAGPRPLFQSLVLFPLTGYRSFHTGMTWGISNPLLPTYQPFPLFMKWQPLVLPLVAARAWLGRRRGEADAAARAVLLLVFCVFSVLGILYNPGYTHLAMVAPLFWIAAAELTEWTLRCAVSRRVARPLGWLLSCVVLVVSLRQIRESYEVRRRMYTVRADTAFGAIDFMNRSEVAQLEALTELMRGAGNEDLFIYPHHAAAYLITGTRNPTRFQLLLPRYNTPEQVAEVIDALEAKQVPYIAVLGGGTGAGAKTPFWRYMSRHYRRVPLGHFRGRQSPLFQRIEAGRATPLP